MNIKVITRHCPSNYGSLLQSIATITVVERLGCECQIIDYVRSDERGLKAILTALKHKKEWSRNPLKKMAYMILRYPEERWAQYKFDRMRTQYLKLTTRCNSVEKLSMLNADVFMTGSDQVWGPMLNGNYDEAYFLSFVKDNTKKIAYAASFGRTDFNEQIIADYKKMLINYNSIAVRENSAVDLLNQMNVPCEAQVLDPTLLLTNKEWSKYVNKEIAGKYILVYQLHHNKTLDNYAKRFAEKLGLPLLRISPFFHQIARNGKLIYLPKLGEFLSYIKNCSYFITDSFHGTAFALNFNKQFLEILPNNETGSRNLSILKLTGLEDRIVTDFDDFSIAENNIDYGRVNDILDKERKKSIETLKQMCTYSERKNENTSCK